MFSLSLKRFGIGLLALTLVASGLKANEEIYRQTAQSTALIKNDRGGQGTGWLINAEDRLLVTARHVVADGNGGVFGEVDVTFAQVDETGAIINDASYYIQNKAAMKGKIVYESKRSDMALIQLPNIPNGMKPLLLSKAPARPGQMVHVVGNSTVNEGSLFAYCYGKVRNTFLYDPPGNPIQARVVAHHAPTNHGDSGGPVVNDKGEVLGFISTGTNGVPQPAGRPFHAMQVTDYSIDAFEIQKGLNQWRSQRAAVKNR